MYNIHASRIAGNGYFGSIWFDSISYLIPKVIIFGSEFICFAHETLAEFGLRRRS